MVETRIGEVLVPPIWSRLNFWIPVSYSLPEDSLIWLGNKNGSFTVKNAYYIAAKIAEQGEHGEGTSDSSALPLWRKIWQLKVPPKVKIFS